MTRTAILYYSRSGTTKKLAEALGEALDAQVIAIGCPRYSGGWLGYVFAAVDSLRGRMPDIDIPAISWSDFDRVVLGSPIWTSYPATPLRSFLQGCPDLPGRVALFLTSGGHSPQEKAVEMVAGLLPKPLEATLALPEAQVKAGTIDAAVARFVAELDAGNVGAQTETPPGA